MFKYFLKIYIPLSGKYSRMNLPKTNDNDGTHKNDANTLSWHMIYASSWASALYDQFKSLVLEY